MLSVAVRRRERQGGSVWSEVVGLQAGKRGNTSYGKSKKGFTPSGRKKSLTTRYFHRASL
jgi:hypothetical protein